MPKKIDVHKSMFGLKPKVGNTIFIAIDGHGGSGKSTLADYLSKELNAEVIHTDDFASFDNPLDWWPLVIEKIFKKIEAGSQALSYERAKWWKDHQPEDVVGQPVTKVMILEGVSSMRKEFEQYVSFNIFVQAPRDICFKRGVERDIKNGKSKEEVVRLWNEWLDEEDKYFERDTPAKKADIIIDGTKPLEDQIVGI